MTGRDQLLGFVPFDGPNLGIFFDDNFRISAPAIAADKLVQLTVENLQPAKASSHPIEVGDVCYLPGHPSPCVVIARVPGQGPLGFLVLEGELKGEILAGYQPQVRIGTVAVDPI